VSDSFYPDYELPVIRELAITYRRFSELREHVLLEHGLNTARAYWGDLDDVFRWAAERDKDVLALSEKDIRQYLARLRRRKYSESTVRRRITALRKFYAAVIVAGERVDNPAARIVVRKR
jgi:site-specific recombinase XerD